MTPTPGVFFSSPKNNFPLPAFSPLRTLGLFLTKFRETMARITGWVITLLMLGGCTATARNICTKTSHTTYT
ncbi:hypothetical protein [Salmonella enterica]|uniref:hypothetical protein n=1 Tax=Salmonella enterica TaxID=28901 RepID=UPI002159DBA8|nr:hypothetical protein [Salmonella enterica]